MVLAFHTLISQVPRKKTDLNLYLPLSITPRRYLIHTTTAPVQHFKHIHSSADHNLYCYQELLRACIQNSDLHHGKAIHTKLIKQNLHFTFIYNHLLNMYVKCSNDINDVVNLFDEMTERNVVTWSLLMTGYVQHGFPSSQSLTLIPRMIRDGTIPNSFTLVTALKACCSSSSQIDHVFHAYQIYSLIVRLGLGCNNFLVNAFLTALISNDRLKEALKAFDECANKDLVSWNAMMAGYLQHSPEDISLFWLRMIRAGVKPDGFSFSTVISGLVAVNMGLQVHGQLVKYGHGNETCVGNSLITMYLKFGDLVNATKAFDEMGVKKNVLSYTAMATGCLNCGQGSKAIELIRDMRIKTGMNPNKFTLATDLSACAAINSLEKGKKAHGLRIKLGREMDTCVDNALINMYAKCGSMDTATTVFRRMKDPSVLSWSTLIIGFARNGEPGEAIRVFDEMVSSSGLEPNYITFVCVLYACSQGGFIETGWRYFYAMSSDYGITPGEDHYACMVDMLGRAGRIKEATDFISKMPWRPGLLVWKTLLSSCYIHGDVETGKEATKQALDLGGGGSDPGTYVLVSNMFAGLRHWDAVEKMRDLMDTRNVRKVPGMSWI